MNASSTMTGPRAFVAWDCGGGRLLLSAAFRGLRAAVDTVVEAIQSGVSVLLPEDELQVRASAVVAGSVSPEVVEAAKRRA